MGFADVPVDAHDDGVEGKRRGVGIVLAYCNCLEQDCVEWL